MTRSLALGGKLKSEGWVRLGTVESDSEPGVEHVISRRGTQIGCDCMSYRFRKGEKTCKHIEAFAIGSQEALAARRGTEPFPERRVPGKQRETFTVRRAFAFKDA